MKCNARKMHRREREKQSTMGSITERLKIEIQSRKVFFHKEKMEQKIKQRILMLSNTVINPSNVFHLSRKEFGRNEGGSNNYQIKLHNFTEKTDRSCAKTLEIVDQFT